MTPGGVCVRLRSLCEAEVCASEAERFVRPRSLWPRCVCEARRSVWD